MTDLRQEEIPPVPVWKAPLEERPAAVKARPYFPLRQFCAFSKMCTLVAFHDTTECCYLLCHSSWVCRFTAPLG